MRIASTFVAAALACAFGLATQPARAAPQNPNAEVLTQAERSELARFMTTYGVPAATQVELLAKVSTGEPWDSLTDAQPVDTKVAATPGELREVATFADGSIAVTTMETPATTNGGIGVMSVGGCTMGGVGTVNRTMKGCEVQNNLGLLKMAFYANYTYTYGSLTDPWVKSASIQRVYNPTAMVIGGSFDDLKVEITRTSAATRLPARARASMIATVVGDFVSKSCWVQLNVPIGSYSLAYTTFSF